MIITKMPNRSKLGKKLTHNKICKHYGACLFISTESNLGGVFFWNLLNVASNPDKRTTIGNDVPHLVALAERAWQRSKT